MSLQALPSRETSAPLPADLLRRLAQTWVVIAAIAYVIDLARTWGAHLTDPNGRPLGDDFVNFWSGPYLAWHGQAADIYNWPVYHAFQQGVFGAGIDAYNYSYPPVLLLLTAPLALLPYLSALAVWLIGSWLLFLRALRNELRGRDGLLLALAAPAVFVNAFGGQNGAWTAALLGGGLCLLPRRPVVAGVLFGLLAYKPHLAILIPIALIAGREWRTLFSAGATVAALVLACVLLFGPQMWIDFAHNADALRTIVLEDGTGLWHRTISVFMLVRRLTGSIDLAYAVQAVAALIAAGIVALAWFRDVSVPARNTLLVLGTFLATPYLQDYDLVVGAFVAVWVLGPAGFARSDDRMAQVAALLILVLPLVAASLARMSGLSLGPLLMLPAFILAGRAIPAARPAAEAAR